MLKAGARRAKEVKNKSANLLNKKFCFEPQIEKLMILKKQDAGCKKKPNLSLSLNKGSLRDGEIRETRAVLKPKMLRHILHYEKPF